MKRFICPRHAEDTPSAILYGDRYKCFGCGASGPASELGIEGEENVSKRETYTEDLEAAIARIDTLPTKAVRGFDLPFDRDFYYIVWPDRVYYKGRRWDDSRKDKYKCPSGHKQPLYTPYLEESKQQLIIVEGEFNALSINIPGVSVCSPGGAAQLAPSKEALTFYKQFDRILVMADKDHAGTKGAIQLGAALRAEGKNVKIVLVEEDANTQLIKYGQEGLSKEIRQHLAGSHEAT